MEIDIVTGISQKLDDVFGSSYAIYTDEKKQDFKEPCFFIMDLTAEQKQIINIRYFRQYRFDVQYFPQSKNTANTECRNIKDALFMAMEYINLGGSLIRAAKMRAEIQDNVLHFFVDYDVFVIRQLEAIPKMQILIQAQNLKEGE